MNFPKEAGVTASDEWFGELIGQSLFSGVIQECIDQLRRLDGIKKALFYGKVERPRTPYNRNLNELPNQISAQLKMPPEAVQDLIHGIIGVATEAGEMLEALQMILCGGDLDNVNLLEESGDIKWYLALLSELPNPAGFVWGEDERRCIAKLRKRFGDKFTAHDAINRNLDAERALLESGGEA